MSGRPLLTSGKTLPPGLTVAASPIILKMSRRAAQLEADVARILAHLEPVKPAQGRPALVLTVGLPGSGKSTFCRHLAREIEAAVLESDALRRLLCRRPTHQPAESRRLFDAIHATARRLLLQGSHVIIDATYLREAERQPVYDLAAETGARLFLLYFRAPEEVVAARLASRAAAGRDSSTAGIEVYQRMVQREEPPQREHWLIDTSDAAGTAAVFRRLVDACLAPDYAGALT